jgi:hypothetical protein
MRKDRGTYTGGEVEIIRKDWGLGNHKKGKERNNEKRLGNPTRREGGTMRKTEKSH